MFIAALGLVGMAQAASTPIVVDGELCHPRNLVIRYASPAARAEIARRFSVIRELPQIGWLVVRAPEGRLQATRSTLRQTPGVLRADLDKASRPAYTPNDELWPDQWNEVALRTNYAWDTTKGNGSVIVAVIDTGVKVDHPDLAANIWVNAGEIPGNGVDDDGDGYIDDVNGYDFAYGDSNPDDVYGHGTCCAGLVAAVQDNSIGVSGTAQCKVMALKAAIDEGYFYDSATAPAYLYGADHGARVFSMSYFSDRVSQIEKDAMDYAVDHGVLPVAAAGNSASVYPYYPGGYDNVLAVAAVNGDLSKAGFSNYGSWVDVASPGVGLPTTTNDGAYTTGFAGTSGATPQVAGVAALCFSMTPNATNEEVRDAIEDTATLQNQPPYGEFSNYGLVNAELAVLRMAGGGAPTKPTVARYVTSYSGATPTTIGGFIHLTTNTARIGGRGLQFARVYKNGHELLRLASTRDSVDFVDTIAPGALVVKDPLGNVVANFHFPASLGRTYALIEGSSPGATVTGGFLETLNPDGSSMTCSRTGDGYISLQATFRRVTPKSSMKLTLRRRFTGTSVGTETIYLYDWSSASYPYGSFVAVGSQAVPTSMTTTVFDVPNAGRFVDPEGTVYLAVATSNDLPEGAMLELDQASLR